MEDNRCVYCSKTVRLRQQALLCDVCNQWQHRVCNTGISQEVYRRVNKGLEDIGDWKCSICSLTHMRISNEMNNGASDILEEEIHLYEDQSQDREEISQTNTIQPSEPAEQHSFSRPSQLDESLMDTRPVTNLVINHEPPTVVYNIVKGGTQLGKDRLVDNIGFAYAKKQEKKGIVYWKCSVRSRSNVCPATVIQSGDCFTAGSKPHNHDGTPGIEIASSVSVEIKRNAKSNLYTSAQNIVENYIVDNEVPISSALPSVTALCKRANRHRAALRPKEPTNLDYEFDDSFFPPEFWKGDVRVGDARHLIFATDKQLEVMRNAKVWYMDGTFRIVKPPFRQLYTIHTFIVSENGEMKQVPTVNILMSRQREIDYSKVFQEILEKMGGVENVRVQRCMLDFEKGTWNAVRAQLGNVEIRGCSFHWQKAIFSKVQKLGLEGEYQKRTDLYNLIKKLMALQFLHHSHIAQEFNHLKEEAGDPTLQRLFDYMEDQWIVTRTMPAESWSVFGLTVRTNNDCEGWHRRINNRAGKRNLQLFLLIDLLHKEACFLPQMIEYVQWGQMCRRQRKKGQQFNAKLDQIWTSYERKDMTPRQTLSAISNLLKH